ncbi:MAG: hypothetical protein Q8868_10105 [Bacteroidota bacterium]|nr:hypothetical protein [Bacteroidota bacterium]
MKKVAVLSMTFLLAMSMVMGQATKKKLTPLKKLEGKEINVMAKNSFITAFGNLPNVKWERSANFDEALFMKNGKEMKAYFDYEGKLVGTTTHVTFADIPANAQKEIQSKYKDYTIVPAVVFFDDNEVNDTDMMLYGVQFEDADNYFVELTKGTKKIVLQVNTEGMVFFFKELS